MSIMDTDPVAVAPPPSHSFRFRATDVTGSLEIEAELQPEVPAGAAARMLAQKLSLPAEVPWALRSERGAFLDDARQIGEQLEPNETAVLTPRAHLG